MRYKPSTKLTLTVTTLSILGAMGFVWKNGYTKERAIRSRLNAAEGEGNLAPWKPAPIAGELQAKLKALEPILEEALDQAPPAPRQATIDALGDEEQLAEATKWIDALAPIYLDPIEKLVQAPEVQAAIQSSKPLSIEKPSLLDSRRAADAFCSAALIEACVRKDEVRAIERLKTCLDLAQIYFDGSRIGLGVRAALHGNARRTIMTLLEKTGTDPQFVRDTLGPYFQPNWSSITPMRIARNEFSMARDQLDRFCEARKAGELSKEEWGISNWNSYRYFHFFNKYLGRLDNSLAAASLDPQEYLRFREGNPFRDVLGVIQCHYRSASDSAFLVYLALCAYRSQHGSYPKDYAAWYHAESLPLDPHTGSRFRFEKTEEGLTLGPAAIAKFASDHLTVKFNMGLAYPLPGT